MQLRFDKHLILHVDGVKYTELSADEKKNVRLRIANFIRTNGDEDMIRSLACSLLALYGTHEPMIGNEIPEKYWNID